MKILSKFFSFIFIIGCSYSPKEHTSTNNTFKTSNNPNGKKYNQLIEGLKHDHVLYYRKNKSIRGDLTNGEISYNDSAFRLDSIKYFEYYQDFFRQDRDFINWLLTFKYDTVKSGLWIMNHDPYSSYISECNLPDLNNSRAAIILLENFLAEYEDGFKCLNVNINMLTHLIAILKNMLRLKTFFMLITKELSLNSESLGNEKRPLTMPAIFYDKVSDDLH